MTQALPDERGRFDAFGGRYVPETLMAPLQQLTEAYLEAKADPKFQQELNSQFGNTFTHKSDFNYPLQLFIGNERNQQNTLRFLIPQDA